MTAARRLREEKEAREAKGGGGDDGESHVSIVGLDAFKGRDLTRGALSAMWRWDRVNVLQLAEFTTEKDFASSIERFYFEESMDPSIMVVAADPLLCGASLINHARYICEKQRQARSKWRLINVSAKFQSEVEGYAQTDEGRANMNATGTARTAGGAGGAGGAGRVEKVVGETAPRCALSPSSPGISCSSSTCLRGCSGDKDRSR